MKIIDKETGKRLKEIDPVKGNPEKEEAVIESENSPMDPPGAYEEIAENKITDEELDESLKLLIAEHDEAKEVITVFEKALIDFKKEDYKLSESINEGFKAFFTFFDDELLPHNRKEEKTLFPILNKRLIESEERSPGDNPMTAIDMMEDDHVKFIQLGTLTFNLLGLAARFRDEQSRTFTYDVAFNNGMELVELLKLHIFREDTTLFPLAQKYLTKAEFVDILKAMNHTPGHQHSASCSH
ncbi:MAG: hemerythrin domain-containing protein [Flavobacteriales bacterium]|nr:hemerythrin domain-containing protein [Flavobacteriales bacterium]